MGDKDYGNEPAKPGLLDQLISLPEAAGVEPGKIEK